MDIRIRYRSNRIDVFDTDTFTKSEPFGNVNMLTDFEILFDQLGDTGIWLAAHSYDASQSYRGEAKDDSIPVAHRKKGWRFLLAESSEIDGIETVSIEGSIVLQRICGELVDVLKLDETASAWIGNSDSLAAVDKATELFETLLRSVPAGIPPEEVARMCGCSMALMSTLQAMGIAMDGDDGEEETEDGDWMEGLDHEDVD
ncbi:hypothetical protein [Changpingibacter yushuensis]|uniref:hypothetical protein n=1 Tax=Changpingibacter yushuensis TaxID=2758440 RepID=UPI0015F4F4C2|nr:hypothetical protein [Changpingibacter yushuensis]